MIWTKKQEKYSQLSNNHHPKANVVRLYVSRKVKYNVIEGEFISLVDYIWKNKQTRAFDKSSTDEWIILIHTKHNEVAKIKQGILCENYGVNTPDRAWIRQPEKVAKTEVKILWVFQIEQID